MWPFKKKYFTYHYCVLSANTPSLGMVSYADGVIRFKTKFTNDQYNSLRETISKNSGFEKFTILSFTLVGEEDMNQ